ncbi:hypothetical protein PENSPDRAFT_692567 [Peniophora sp. CONT]|nr:hypothetical protein PENSPDRAFT_692567 [Peniophora sp. CONT]
MALVAVGMLGVAAYQAVSKRREVKRQLHEQEALVAAGAVPIPFLEQVSSVTLPGHADTPEPGSPVSRFLPSPSKSVRTGSTSNSSIVSGPSTPSTPLTSSVCEVAALHVDEPRHHHPRRVGRTLRRHLKRDEAAREEFDIDPADDAPPPSYQEATAATTSRRRQLEGGGHVAL